MLPVTQIKFNIGSIWELDGDISSLPASIETPARKLLLMSVLTKDAKLLHTRLYLNNYALGKVSSNIPWHRQN